jgi:hypothetical protein
MGISRAYEEIDDDAADRIISTVDTTGDWYDIRKRLVKRFPKWTAYQRDRMSSRILDRRIEVEEFEKGKITKKYTQMAVDQAVSVGGTKKARYKVVKSIDGKYLGREGNIRVVTRKDKAVWAKNLRTGRIARIK